MKTTLNINDGLLRRAKRRAAETGVTLTSIIEDALRGFLAAKPARTSIDLPVVRGGRVLVDVADRDELYDRMEERR